MRASLTGITAAALLALPGLLCSQAIEVTPKVVKLVQVLITPKSPSRFT
jgi:hypothetical protein